MYNFDERQLQKLETLRREGINPYPSGVGIVVDDILSAILQHGYVSLGETEACHGITTAGRLRFKNEMGNIGFGRIEIADQVLQFSIQKNKVSKEVFQAWKRLDLGDWVLITGTFTRTRTGELTLSVSALDLYSKCLSGMPDKVNGLVDPETRQRMRYLDLIVNQESRANFKKRFEIIKYVRHYLEDQDFVEVETPILQTIPGGASARPFITHHNTLDTDLYLRIAPELYLKRLIVGGFDRVFELGKNFRNEGVSTKHNPEFTMVEFYQAHATYQDGMKLTQNLIIELISSVCRNYTFQVPYGDRIIDFSKWGILKFEETLQTLGIQDPWSLEDLQNFIRLGLSDEEVEILEAGGLSTKLPTVVSELQQLVFEGWIEPNLINPTFITHYPTSISPLARQNDDDPRVTDRFELFINGFEVANGFSELNDPVEQARRFSEQASRKDAGDQEAMYFDSDYIKALTYAMPPCAGVGIGIDRLVMLLTNTQSIRDIILFPNRKEHIEWIKEKQ